MNSLSGKCKEEFREYLLNGIVDASYTYRHFITLPKSMRYGVLEDYFDSVDIRITINAGRSQFWADIYIDLSKDLSWDSEMIDTRQETKDLAVEKANELRNEELNK